MSNLFLYNVNQKDSSPSQPKNQDVGNNSGSGGSVGGQSSQTASWSTNLSDLEDFKRRYQQEASRGGGSTSATFSQSSPFPQHTPNTPSPQLKRNSLESGNVENGRYRSMVEGFMNETPISSTSTSSANRSSAGSSGGLFLPFMEKQEPERKQEQHPQNQQHGQQPQSMGGLFSQPQSGFGSSPLQQQQQQQQQAPPMNFPSFESPHQQQHLTPPPSSFGQQGQQQNQQHSPSIQQLLAQGYNQGMMGANQEQMHQMAMMQQQMLMHQQHPQQYMMQSGGGYGNPPLQTGMSPHLQQFASQYAAPTPVSSPQTPLTGQQHQQNIEEQFTQKVNLFESPQQGSPGVNVSQVSNQSADTQDDTESVKTRTRKPSISVDNQLVYLYPRHGRMEKTFTTLSNVHVRYGSFMSTPDVYFIARNHLKDLAVENPYIDDYYFLIHMTMQMKSAPAELSKWIKKNIQERLNPPEKDPGPQFDTRLFGRISGITPKAPRVVVDDVEQSNLPKNSKLQSSSIGLQCQIEDCFDDLLIIEDYNLCTTGKSRTNLDISEAIQRSEKIVKFIKSKYMDILSTSKGVKFVCKALRLLPEDFSILLLELICNKWDDLNKSLNLFSDQSLLLNGMCACVQKVSNLETLTKLLSTFVQSKNVLTVRIRNSVFVQVLAMVMKRAGDLRDKADKKVLDEWNRVFSNLIFLSLKQLGFKTVVETISREELTWFLLASLLVHCQRQQRQQLLDHLKGFTQTKEAESNTSIQTFLTVVKETNKIK